MKGGDTIAAIATPLGRGGIGVIRVSGPKVKSIAEAILRSVPLPRLATWAQFKDETSVTIDEGLALFFPEPHSFTGEDVLEFQGHGGPIVPDQLLHVILRMGARLARPGEFSERAFLNEKMDLVQAEAILDLIDASSQQAARAALRSLQGEFSKRIQSLCEQVIQLRIRVEASIDFPEEEIDFLADREISQRLQALIHEVEKIKKAAQQGALLREGMTVVIAGKPNAGKSSLLNCLVKRDAAIVTDIPGTTRDVLREYIQLDGMPLHIIDTAGLRETGDRVEQEGVRRAKAEIEKADMVLLVVDTPQVSIHEIQAQLRECQTMINSTVPIVVIKNKIDLVQENPGIQKAQNETCILLSAKNQIGIDVLEKYLKQFMGFESVQQEDVFIARRRHLEAIHKTEFHLSQGQQQLQKHRAGELLAQDLRYAHEALSEITGEFTADDLLGEIFSSFCIGK